MKIKRYTATDMRTAIRQVRDELGADAVILSTQQAENGVELVAAMDYDETSEQALYPAPDAVLPAPATDPAVKDLRREMKSLRAMLETQLTQLNWNERSRRSPLTVQALRNLSRMGLSPALVERVVREVGLMHDYREAWQAPLRRLLEHLPIVPATALPATGAIALVGPTGAGKTTAIARLAARHVLAHGRGGLALVCADTMRVGAREQLKAYGEIMGAPVYVAGDAAELDAVLKSLASTRLVLVDTAGLPHGDPQFAEQTAGLRHARRALNIYVTLPANAQRDALLATLDAYAGLEPDGCVLTKIDEASSLGGAISAVIERSVPLAWLSNGQRVPDDMYPADSRGEWLIRLAVERLKTNRRIVSETYMAENFQEAATHADS